MNSAPASEIADHDRTQPNLLTGLSKDTILLAFASLFSDISSEMLYPVLPIFLTQTLRAPGSVVGVVEGLASAAQNVVQGFSGWLSDRLQKRKPLALAGYLASTLAKPLMGAARSWPGLLGGRVIDRLGAGFRSAPRDALIAASADERYRGRAFGLEGIGDNLGACLGPLLTWWLIATFAYELRSIFFIAVVPGLLACAMILFVRERPIGAATAHARRAPLRELPLGYWKYLAVTALFGIGASSSNAFIILQTKSIGGSFGTALLAYAGFNFVAAAVSYPAGSISDKLGRRNVLLTGFMIAAIAYAGFALTTNVAVICALFVAYGSFQGTFRAVGKAFASDFVPEHLRARAIGWYSMTVGFAGLVANLVAGLLWDRAGHAAVFYYGALSAMAGSIALVALVPAAASDVRTAGL